MDLVVVESSSSFLSNDVIKGDKLLGATKHQMLQFPEDTVL